MAENIHLPPPPPVKTSVKWGQGVEGQEEHVKGQVFMSRGLSRVHFFKFLLLKFVSHFKNTLNIRAPLTDK